MIGAEDVGAACAKRRWGQCSSTLLRDKPWGWCCWIRHRSFWSLVPRAFTGLADCQDFNSANPRILDGLLEPAVWCQCSWWPRRDSWSYPCLAWIESFWLVLDDSDALAPCVPSRGRALKFPRSCLPAGLGFQFSLDHGFGFYQLLSGNLTLRSLELELDGCPWST